MKKILILLFITGCSYLYGQTGVPTLLKCEHLVNPLGIDNKHPRLSWVLEDTRLGACQQTYRIMVDTDSLSLINNNGRVWDTGEVTSDKMQTVYAGNELKPFTKYYWCVRICNKEGERYQSAVSSFETAMMNISDWNGAWISDGQSREYHPAPYFRKEFSIGKKSNPHGHISQWEVCMNFHSMGRKWEITVWTQCLHVLNVEYYM